MTDKSRRNLIGVLMVIIGIGIAYFLDEKRGWLAYNREWIAASVIILFQVFDGISEAWIVRKEGVGDIQYHAVARWPGVLIVCGYIWALDIGIWWPDRIVIALAAGAAWQVANRAAANYLALKSSQ